MLVNLIESVYRLLWGDLFILPLGGGIGISFMVVLLLAAGIWFTSRTRLLPVRLFRDMIAAVCEKKQGRDGLSSFQTLIISTATRVGMGNLVGVVAAVSAGGAGAVFWMWVTALLGASTSFIESTLAQKYRQPDPLYGGWRGGPAYYLHVLAERKRGKKLKRSVTAALFAASGLICWCGISQVISNSVSSAFENAFHIPPLATTLVLTAIAAVIVLRRNATVKSLDVMVPIMAVCYFVITVGIVLFNLPKLPAVLGRIFTEAFGLRQAVAGGFGAVLMNGVKRGLFSNEAGSGSAPCAAAAAECDDPVKMGFVQALGVLIDTVVICSCTAFLMLLVPQERTAGLAGMDLLQKAMQYHLGSFGIVFIAVTLALFSFSTFLGVLYYARGNVAYLCGDNWWSQTAYKLIALVMLVIGGMQAYTVVWDLGDVGIGLMTIFNMLALVPMAHEALDALNDDPVKMGFVQALGVLIDTVVICSCTAFLMLLVPQERTAGLAGMDLLQKAMQYHLGSFGIVFIAVTLALFSFSTFLGVLYYARGNVAYLCGDNWWSQTAYKLIALVMLVIGGMQAYTVVWDLGDVGIGLMTIFNMLALVPMAHEALDALNDYEKRKKLQ